MELAMFALKSRSIYSPFLTISFLYFIFSPDVHAQAKTTTYTYDALGRLTFVGDSVNGNRDYDYDKAGNRLLVATNVASDAAAEPGSVTLTLPAPTNPYKSLIGSCAWRATWDSVTGAAKYKVKDTNGVNQWVVITEAIVQCPVGASSSNMPKTVQACNVDNICGQEANF
jgi:hypothetical protein